MKTHTVATHKPGEIPARADLLAYKLAGVAVEDAPMEDAVAAEIVNRLIDNTGVAAAALARRAVANARVQATARPDPSGACVYGLPPDRRIACEWAAWANATAVRELDYHDTFLAADMNHPGDMIPAILAAAQQCGSSGADLMRGIATAYEVDVALTKAICLHKHRIDHFPHLAAGAVCGIGAMLRLDRETVFQALNHAVHVNVMTRQSRKGELSSWKAHAPGHMCKLVVEAVDRALRGETSPSPIYEGDDSIIAWLLDGPEAVYEIGLVEAGEPRRGILETYTKAYSAEIQSQALIDLAFRLREKIADPATIERIVVHTSHHTHRIIGNGANDPQKYDPAASRETLDHSAMYIMAVALEDGRFHHIDSYLPERAARPETVRLWRAIETVEDAAWTEAYHHPDPMQRAFGGRAVVTLTSGETVEAELRVADAHPNGERAFGRDQYVEKYESLCAELIDPKESARFLEAALNCADLPAGALHRLNIEAPAARRDPHPPARGLFDQGR